jgi:glycerol-3-phosphate acyltransferase PlsY
LALDILKGFIIVTFLGDFLAPRITTLSNEALRIILGLSSISGHNWTVFLSFKGGKGMATTLGVLLGLAVKISGLRVIFGLVTLTWLLIFIIGRIVSLASVIATVTLPFYMLIFRQSAILTASSIIIALFIVLRHHSNLKRILQGKEPRLF